MLRRRLLGLTIRQGIKLINRQMELSTPALNHLTHVECDRLGSLLGALYDVSEELGALEDGKSSAEVSAANEGVVREIADTDSCERHGVAGGPCCFCLVEQNVRLIQKLNNRDALIASLSMQLETATQLGADAALHRRGKVGAA